MGSKTGSGRYFTTIILVGLVLGGALGAFFLEEIFSRWSGQVGISPIHASGIEIDLIYSVTHGSSQRPVQSHSDVWFEERSWRLSASISAEGWKWYPVESLRGVT